MTGPLVVQPEHEDAEPLESWEGAGLASSVADLGEALAAGDPAQVGWTAAGVGLDALDAVASPLDAFLAAGIGWAIEHVSFLHEPLDALAGDPTQIRAQAQTWHNVGAELGRVGVEYRAAAAAAEWDGAASDAYRATVERFAGALDDTAQSAARLADLILDTGTQVATTRALIRDAIAGFVADAIEVLVMAGLLAAVTAGGALGAATLRVVVAALDLADDIVRRIARLLDELAAAGGTAQRISDAVRQTAAQVAATAPVVRAAAEPVADAAAELRVAAVVEAGKQTAEAEQEQRGWSRAPG